MRNALCCSVAIPVLGFVLGFQEQEKAGTVLDRSVLASQEELSIYDEADVVAHYEHWDGAPAQLFLLKPDRTDESGKLEPLTPEELGDTVAGITGKDLAVVQMGKRRDQWPRNELDEIDVMFRRCGFRRVVIFQAVGVGPTPTLRGAKNVWD